MGSTPPDHVQNGVRSIAAKRQVTLSECESEYDAARNWLAKAIESSRRQILESAGLDLERDEEQRQHNDKKRRVGSLGKPGGTRSVADEVVVAASAVADQKENVVNMTTMTTDEETKKPVKSAKGGKKKKKKTTKKTSGKAAPKQPAAKVQQPTLDVYSLKVAQLRAELRSRGMDAAGLKRDLQARLAQRIEQEMREAAAGDDDDEHGKDSDDDEEEEMEEEKEEESNVEAMDNDNNADEMHVEEGEEEGKPAADAGVGTTTAYASESVVQLMSPEQIAAASDFPGVDVKALSAKKANPPPANLPAAAKKISFALDDKILTNEDGEIEEVEVVKDDVEEDDDASIGYDDAMEIDSSAPVVTGSETGGEEDVDMMDATSPSSSSTHRVTSSTGQDIAGTASSSEQQQPVQVHADDSIKSPKKKGLGKKILSATANLFSPPTKKSKSPTPKSTQQAQMNEVETKPTSETIPPQEQTTDAPALAPPSERKVKEANDFFSKFATTDQPAAAAAATVVPPPTKIGSALKTPALRTGLASTAITTSSKSTSGGSKGSVASSASKSSASSAYTSEKSQQRIRELQENAAARKARLAELRAKSKPVPSAKHDSVHNYNPSGGTLMTAAQVAKAKAMSTAEKQKEEKKKLLAAQMREKHFAEAKKQTAVAPTAAAPSVPAIPSQNSNLHVPSAAQPQPNVHSQQYQSKPKTPSQPVPRPEVLSPMDTYEMSDREESDSSDYDSDEDEKARKKIPKWAQKHNLIPALERQFMDGPQRLDPDEIFPEVSTCNLELVFDQKKARYKKRTSSANWAKDRVTAAEKLVYKRTMGFAGKKR